MSIPSTYTAPPHGSSTAFRCLAKVDLPEPLWPQHHRKAALFDLYRYIPQGWRFVSPLRRRVRMVRFLVSIITAIRNYFRSCLLGKPSSRGAAEQRHAAFRAGQAQLVPCDRAAEFRPTSICNMYPSTDGANPVV